MSNKPTKQTLSDLTSELEALDYVLAHRAEHSLIEDTVHVLESTRSKVGFALRQLLQDDELPCGAPGCSVVKPTKRALAAHQTHCFYHRNQLQKERAR